MRQPSWPISTTLAEVHGAIARVDKVPQNLAQEDRPSFDAPWGEPPQTHRHGTICQGRVGAMGQNDWRTKGQGSGSDSCSTQLVISKVDACFDFQVNIIVGAYRQPAPCVRE